MDAHAMIGERKSSWAVTFKRLLEDNIKVHGVQSYNKHSKQEKTKDGKNNISSSRYGQCTHDRNDNGEDMGISYMYNFGYNLDLGIGKVACRRISCA